MNRSIKTINVVTPCFNAAQLIEKTVKSVLTNIAVTNGELVLNYLVQDGKSQDDTVAIVERLFNQYAPLTNVNLHIYSEPDRSTDDALGKAFSRLGAGDINCFINAGDFYPEYAFGLVSRLFTEYDIRWLTGLKVMYNEGNHIVHVKAPYIYRQQLIVKGFYGRGLPYIQQESTFWDRSLHEKIDIERLRALRLAGDYFLWRTFADYAQLTVVHAWLGGWKMHPGQLSSQYLDDYKSEIGEFCRAPNLLDYLLLLIDKPIWHIPFLARRLNRNAIVFDRARNRYLKGGR
jgi:glycosyltransferase involved in cell wall biosynthesis